MGGRLKIAWHTGVAAVRNGYAGSSAGADEGLYHARRNSRRWVPKAGKRHRPVFDRTWLVARALRCDRVDMAEGGVRGDRAGACGFKCTLPIARKLAARLGSGPFK